MENMVTDINITVLGLGFVGLTAAAGFATKGFTVTAFDIDENRRQLIASGVVPFHEPGLTTTGIHVATTQDEATLNAHVVFICVGTPQGEHGDVDLRYIEHALQTLNAPADCLVVIKSTVPPGTTANLTSRYKLANNPEFLREGRAWPDFMMPDRIICGVTDEASKALLSIIYSRFEAPIHFTTLSTAEFIKYLSNTLLATLISYANEMSLIADHMGNIDTKAAFQILHQDKRLEGSGIASYIYPGAGYGGYCLPKDTQAMAYVGGDHANILKQVIATNNHMPTVNLAKIIQHCPSKTTSITILGLSFKPDSDDVRDSTAAKIIAGLLASGYSCINAYDPLAMSEFQKHYDFDITYSDTLGEVVVIATGWQVFKQLDLTGKQVVDLRYLL